MKFIFSTYFQRNSKEKGVLQNEQHTLVNK